MANNTNNTSKNSNLFYQLYSHPNDVVNSGFVCNSAIDETDTSADFSNDALEITDSNGDVLSSIDLSDIHTDGIQEYYNETKIIGPQSAYLLQGNVLGETYASQHFIVPEEISSVYGYESYINVAFDIHYISCGEMKAIRLDSYRLRTAPGNVCKILQDKLDSLKIPVSVTIRKETIGNCINAEECCDVCATEADFLVFQSSEEGYSFYVHTVMVTPVDSEYMNYNKVWTDYTDSPFIGANIDFDYIIDLLKTKKPRHNGNEDNSDYNRVPCDIYKYVISIAPMAIDDNFNFRENLRQLIEFAQCFNEDGTIIDEMQTKFVFLSHMYPDIYTYYWGTEYSLLKKYNIHDIIEVLGEIAEYVATGNISLKPVELNEDTDKRIYNQKYFNGAFRGIAIIPDWPSEANEMATMRLAHVPDYIIHGEKIELPDNMRVEGFKCNECVDVFIKVRSMVKINTLLQSEYEIYKQCNCDSPVRKVTSNEQLATCVEGLWSNSVHEPISDDSQWTSDYNYSDVDDVWSDTKKHHTHAEHINETMKYDESVIDEFDKRNYDFLYDVPYKKHKHSEKKKEYVTGLYGFMSWLNENDLWTKLGDAYINIAKKDDYQSKLKNLQNSVLLYNPNNYPIRVKFLVFS